MSSAPSVLRLCLAALSCTLAPFAVADEIRLEAPSGIVALLAPHLPETAPGTKRLQQQLSDILATEGYFSPRFDFVAGDALLVRISPGPRTLITQVDIKIDGELEPTFKDKLLADWALPVGQPFRQSDWNTAKQDTLAALLEREYAAARLIDSEAEIDVDKQAAKLTLHYATGPKYVFGELRTSGLNRFSPTLVNQYNRSIKVGEPYSQDKLNTLQGALQASPYFSSVQLGLGEAEASNADGRVSAPVLLSVREQAAHRFRLGGGLSSNTGARVEFNYQTPNFMNQPWLLDAGVRLEQKKQTAYADVLLPPTERNSRLSVGAMAENTDIQELKTERLAFGVQDVQQRGSIEQRLSLNWQEEYRLPTGAKETSTQALVPNVMWIWRQLDKPLDPDKGIVLQGAVGGGSKMLLTDQDFLRLYGRYQQFIPLNASNKITLRSEVGITLTDINKQIPQDYLFRTGGATSVRGYTYQSLGIREGNAVVGARYLVVASAEYTHWLDDAKGVALFVDAGDAFDVPKDTRLAVGYGIGGRWRSPAGPIGVDVAYGQRTQDVHVHFNLTIPF